MVEESLYVFEGKDFSMKRLLALIILLTILLLLHPLVYGEVTHYIGNVIEIRSRDEVYVTAFISPMGIDWSEWKEKYFDPNPDYYYQGLLSRIAYMLKLSRFMLLDYGVDDSKQRVYVRARFSLSDSGYYDSDLDCLSVLDVFKWSGRGYFDYLEVRSNLRIYRAEPTPDASGPYFVRWNPTSFEGAPLWYRIYLSPLMSVSVSLVGLPSGYTVSLYVGDKKLGDLTPGVAREFLLKEGTYAFVVRPDTIEVGKGVRYKARESSISVSSSGSVTFEYAKQVLVTVSTANAPARVRVDGAWYSAPAELWLDAGQHELYVEPVIMVRLEGNGTRVLGVFSQWSISSGGRGAAG